MRQLIFLIACVPLFAQGKWDSLIIRYNYCLYRGDSLIWPSFSYYKEGTSVFVVEHSKVGVDDEDIDKLDPGVKIVVPKGPDKMYFFNLKTLPPICFHREVLFGSPYSIADNEQLVWHLTKETKKILGYNCQKAITTFRSRQYEAWFTPEIPVPIGPWKLRGLGGAILEARSLDRVYSYVATEIHFKPTIFFTQNNVDHANLYKKFPHVMEEFMKRIDQFLSWNDYVKKVNQDFLNRLKYDLSKDENPMFYVPPYKQEKEFDLSKEELLKMYPEFKNEIEKLETY